MSEPAPINGPAPGGNGPASGGNRPLSGVGRTDAAKPARDGATENAGAEFQAMLDKIEERARSLAQQSRAVEKPEELAGAVDSARESLEDVLSLKDRLLEEYRQAQRQDPPAESSE